MSVNQNIHNPYIPQQPHQQQIHMNPAAFNDGAPQLNAGMPGVLPVTASMSQQIHQRQNMPPQNMPPQNMNPQNMPPQNMTSQWGGNPNYQQQPPQQQQQQQQQSRKQPRDNNVYSQNTQSPHNNPAQGQPRDYTTTPQQREFNPAMAGQPNQHPQMQPPQQHPPQHPGGQQFHQQQHNGSTESYGRNIHPQGPPHQIHQQPLNQQHMHTQPPHIQHQTQMQPPNHNQQARVGMINNKGNSNMTQGMQHQNNNSNPNKQLYNPKNNHSKQNEEKQDQAPPASSNKNVDSTPSNAESDGDKPSKEETATEKPSNTSNNKEKTPMCLINELSFHNKVRHQYTLIEERGPAHEKEFDVKLELGTETYTASGPSIKKAQHAAAAVALKETTYTQPPPRSAGYRRPPMRGAGYRYDPSLPSPIIELNNLAAKLGESTVYQTMDPGRAPYYPPPNFDFRGMYNQRYHYGYSRVFFVSLKIGGKEFMGNGHTQLSARQNAAMKALNVIGSGSQKKEGATKAENGESGATKSEPAAVVETPAPIASVAQVDSAELKSDVSQVYEIAMRRNLPVEFEVTDEFGLAHKRVFVTRCVVGELSCDGRGSKKRLSKQDSARLMLIELAKLGPLPISPGGMRYNRGGYGGYAGYSQKKSSKVIKKPELEESQSAMHPVSRLLHIQQAKKEKEPVFTLVGEHGDNIRPLNRQFTIQVEIPAGKACGIAKNKKQAKKNAAQALLEQLGYSKPGEGDAETENKKTESNGNGRKQRHYNKDQDGTSRQVVPGVLLMGQPTGQGIPDMGGVGYNNTASFMNSSMSPQVIAAIAKELLDTGVSSTADNMLSSMPDRHVSSSGVSPKQQLIYMAAVLGHTVEFTDFPKGIKNKYLSLASISTNPPHVSHGEGMSVAESHDMAAMSALQTLATMDRPIASQETATAST